MRSCGATVVLLLLLGVGACGGGGSGSAEFACSAAEANRPDLPGREAAGTVSVALPRRTCTQPKEGCVASPNTELSFPPAPGIRVARVTGDEIAIDYDVGSGLEDCRPYWLSVALHTTVSGLPPDVHQVQISDPAGTLRVEPDVLPGAAEFGPPDVLTVSSNARGAIGGEPARVRLPPPEGLRALSRDEVRQVLEHREACRADIDDRTRCDMRGFRPSDIGSLHTVSGPVTEATALELAQSVSQSLEGDSSMPVESIECFKGTRCDASFFVGGERLEMSYRIEALQSVPTCWELTGFRVVRPVPKLGNFAAPLPNSGCIDR